MKPLIRTSLVVLVAMVGQVQAQAPDSWIGKRVFTKYGAVLKVRDEVVDDEGRAAELAASGKDRGIRRTYRVEHVQGDWLWLKDESSGIDGWVESKYVLRFEDALAYYTRWISKNPCSRNYIARGSIWRQKGEPDLAIADYNQALHLDPSDENAYCGRGFAWGDKQDYDKSIKDFNEAIRLDPRFSLAYNGRSYAWAGKKDYDHAIADCDRAIRLNPQFALAYLNRGIYRINRKEYDLAIADFDRAIKIDLRYASAYSNRGLAWLWKKDYDRAIADYDEAILFDPKNTSAFVNRGFAFNEKKEYDRAISDFDEAIRIDPKDAAAYYSRGKALAGKKEYDRAITDCNEAIRLDGKESWAFFNRGRIWGYKKDYEQALADYNEAIHLDPKEDSFYNSRAWLHATCPDAKFRDGKKAVESATKACELSEWKEPNHIDTLAASYAELGDFDQAVKWEEQAISLTPGSENEELKGRNERLALFQDKKPYRQP